eukprot:TRINITY_DN10689_c0_g1_i1.p1 TRINITY_DN10689_c0_g1~~TRINITY_DN10689_c0_g1_i1.p1  ORF type:complete len:200 (-),score=24.34 TRINITY_DN10689_c0_g1_i1:172-771(-)
MFGRFSNRILSKSNFTRQNPILKPRCNTQATSKVNKFQAVGFGSVLTIGAASFFSPGDSALKYDRSTPTGINVKAVKAVMKELISAGDGKTYPKKGSTVTIHYLGKLEDNEVFDTSRLHPGGPFTFVIGSGDLGISGLERAIMKMSVGERAYVVVAPSEAYGEKGLEGVIPPNAHLIFIVHLLAVNNTNNDNTNNRNTR